MVGLGLINIHVPPEWMSKKKWIQLTTVSSVFSVAVFIPFYFIDVVTAFPLAVLSYTTVMSFYTDVKFRLVDRRSLNFLIIVSTLYAVPLFLKLSEPEQVVFVFLFLLSFSTIFLPLFGASDGRMLSIGTVLVYPIGELKFFTIALIITATIAVGYGVIQKIRFKVKKVSLPAVPMLSTGFLLSLFLKTLDII